MHHMIHNRFFLLMAGLLGLLSACQPEQSGQDVPPGIELSNMDTTANPAQDFYQFVNGEWLETTEIPSDRSSWGSFAELRKKTDEKVLGVLEEATGSEEYPEGADQAKAAQFFQTAMDTNYLNELGMEPLTPYLEEIDAISSLDDLQAFMIRNAATANGMLFSFNVRADPNNSAINAAFLSTGELGLPERDYYTEDDEDTRNIQQQYRDHVARMYGFLGVDSTAAQETAQRIFKMEQRMAEAMYTKEQRRDPRLSNNPKSVEEVSQLSPAIDWQAYLDGIGAGSVDTLIVRQPPYLVSMNAILMQEDLNTVKDYMKWTTFNNAANYLSQEIVQANFDFYGKVLRGTEEMRPRRERVLSTANWTIGEAIGKLYVDAHFPPEAKETAVEMVENIKAAFGDRIRQLEWMSDSTKEKALAKLSTFNVKIGYPDEWKDYSDLVVMGPEDGGSYLENMKYVSEWNWKRQLEDIGKPVDKDEWFMAPQIVNAYYNPLYNEIVFPAAILQPPFYDYQADAAVNYGGIGAVIGHEISHGFDDQGSRYDAEGNLKNWWTEEDRRRFEARTQQLVKQYNNYEPLEGVNVNGAFTLGENIGDLGGVNVSYDGLQRHLEEKGNPGPIQGFSQAQRFFISWATIWRGKYRDEALKNQIKTDPHSPGQYRAVGPLANMEAFYAAFDVQPGDKLYRPDSLRVKIW